MTKIAATPIRILYNNVSNVKIGEETGTSIHLQMRRLATNRISVNFVRKMIRISRTDSRTCQTRRIRLTLQLIPNRRRQGMVTQNRRKRIRKRLRRSWKRWHQRAITVLTRRLVIWKSGHSGDRMIRQRHNRRQRRNRRQHFTSQILGRDQKLRPGHREVRRRYHSYYGISRGF